VYKHENEDKLQAYGRYNPAACNETLNGRVGNPPGR
jgi:hypothetical protein